MEASVTSLAELESRMIDIRRKFGNVEFWLSRGVQLVSIGFGGT